MPLNRFRCADWQDNRSAPPDPQHRQAQHFTPRQKIEYLVMQTEELLQQLKDLLKTNVDVRRDLQSMLDDERQRRHAAERDLVMYKERLRRALTNARR